MSEEKKGWSNTKSSDLRKKTYTGSSVTKLGDFWTLLTTNLLIKVAKKDW